MWKIIFKRDRHVLFHMILINIEQIYLLFIRTNIIDIIGKILNAQRRKRNKKENGINYIFKTNSDIISYNFLTVYWKQLYFVQ